MGDTPKQEGNLSVAEVVHLERRRLLTRHCAGDPAAFPELVSLFRAQVASYITRCGVPEGARDDVFQEIFVKVHCQAHQYRPELPLEPWLFTIVANTVRSHYRKQRLQQILGEETPDELPAKGADQEAQARGKETARWLEGELDKLSSAQREAVALCCFGGFQQKEAAKILELPVNTVKTNLNRARIALAKALARRNASARREVLS